MKLKYNRFIDCLWKFCRDFVFFLNNMLRCFILLRKYSFLLGDIEILSFKWIFMNIRYSFCFVLGVENKVCI